MILNDIYYTCIFGRHKHYYVRIRDELIRIEVNGDIRNTTYQAYQCETCEKIVGLDGWQIASLPMDMLYERLCEID